MGRTIGLPRTRFSEIASQLADWLTASHSNYNSRSPFFVRVRLMTEADFRSRRA